jgi:hypothetical protein
MIELSKHRTSLVNMQYTIEGLERLDHLIDIYAKPLPGPAYVIFQGLNGEKIETQIDRSFIVPALEQHWHWQAQAASVPACPLRSCHWHAWPP